MCRWGRDGTSWFAQLRLLLWKNWVLKKRRPCATACELLFPVAAVFILLIIRAIVKITDVGDIIPVDDQVRASADIYPMVVSLACGVLETTTRYPFQGIGLAAGPNLVGGASAPEIAGFQTLLREAFAQAGKANDFYAPCCVDQVTVNGTQHWQPGCPMDPTKAAEFMTDPQSSIVQTFDTADAMDAYILNDDYGWREDVRPLFLGVVLDRTPKAHQWSYTLRANSSDVPWTGTNLNTLIADYSKGDFFKYYDDHVLTLQWLLDSYIISLTAKATKTAHTTAAAAIKRAYAFGPSFGEGATDKETAAPPQPTPSVSSFPDVSFVSFPIPAHRQDNFKSYVGQFLGLFLVIAFMWPFSRMVRNMVEEKERKLSESMKMMGLRNSVFWMSWVISYLISFFIVCIFVIGVSKGSLFKYSDSGILFLFFFSFCLSLIALACLVTTFFSRAKTAGTLSPFLLLAMFLPYFSVSDSSKDTNIKNLSCLLSPVALSLGSTQIISYEGVFIGSQWNNASQMVDNFALGSAIALMLFDAVLYGALAWYLDKIWPGEYGTHFKWYFLFTPSYWKGCFACCRRGGHSNRQAADEEQLMYASGGGTPRAGRALKGINVSGGSPSRPAFSSGAAISAYGAATFTTPLIKQDEQYESGLNSPALMEMDDEPDPDFGPDYEPVPESIRSKVGVRIRGLRKEFTRDGQNVVAVKGLDLNLYQGQCFVLLGHNGAGKTTTISMLNGMINSSSGSASIYGREIASDMAEIRTFMGVCPQYDYAVFEDLSVYEHLEFYGKLKGILLPDLHQAVMTAIKEVQLEKKILVKSSDLSGGQRRRLSLAIALIGDSKVVFLDEPTSGVDPFSRRAIWDLLTKKKAGRILVLTTHFMDEADQLGDRIGIMHHGVMKCCGTSLFLKAKYGVGYCMTLVKEPNARVDEVTQLVQAKVPEATMLSSVGSELSYSLPFSSSVVFPELLGRLDDEMGGLGIVNYGLSVTTLEEVFIKVAEEQKPGAQHHEAGDDGGKSLSPSVSHAEALGTSRDSSWCTHFRALLAKRWHIQKRDKKALCCQFLVPVVLLALGLGLLRIPPNFNFPEAVLRTGVGSPYNLPDRIPFNMGLDEAIWKQVHADEGTMEQFAAGYTGTQQNDLYNFSFALLDARLHDKESRYGAFFGTKMGEPQWHQKDWEFTVLSNASAVHGLPAWQALGHQALLRTLTGDETATISATIHPFAWTHRQRVAIQSLNGIFASIVISLAFTFIPAYFAVFIVSEREYKSKHLQLISGVSMTSYWVANFVWDFICFLIPAAISCGIIYAYQNPELIKNFDVLVVSFLAYGISIIPFTYVCSFLFTSHSTAQNVMIMIYILGGIIMTNVVVALYLVPNTQEISKRYLRHVFRLLPSFCLGDAIFYLSAMPLMEPPPGRYDLIITGYDLLYMTLSAGVYFILTLAIDKLSSIPSFVGLFKKDPEMVVKPDEEPEDEDCRAERERLQQSALVHGEGDKFPNLTRPIEQYGAERALASLENNDPRNDLIRIEGLRKVYPKKTAVKDVYFGVPAGQCFGFLGVNGAGKTTTLKILTGDVTPSKGAAYIGGYDIAHYPKQVRQLMGYCPQFDAIFSELTAREHLHFYGKIRGIPEESIERMVGFLIDRLSLTEYADRRAGTYSGGNKRKLSVAIALIGNPPVVFLDEPSTGMDPVSRRFMWDFISETMARRAVILTTHSMEECEALCSRIGILVNGSLKCIGPSQHLKSRFGRGFQIDISTASNDSSKARAFILRHFPDAEPLEDYGSKLKFKILHRRAMVTSPDASGSSMPVEGFSSVSSAPQSRLRDIFALIESHKAEVGISEYSVGQTTLEQIFIRFAKRGDIEEFGGKVKSEEEEEEEALQRDQAAAAQAEAMLPSGASFDQFDDHGIPRSPVRRIASFNTEERLRGMSVTPSSYGYIPATSHLGSIINQ